MNQGPNQLCIDTSAQLLDIHTVSAALRVRIYSIEEMVDDGRLVGAWDVTTRPPRRYLRFWGPGVAAIQARGTRPDMDAAQSAIESCIPPAPSCEQIERLIGVDKPHVYRLIHCGLLTTVDGRVPLAVTRDSLIQFFRSRRVA